MENMVIDDRLLFFGSLFISYNTSLQYIGKKTKVFSLPEKKELRIFSNKHYQNKNDRSHSVLAASKLKVLSRGKIGKNSS